MLKSRLSGDPTANSKPDSNSLRSIAYQFRAETYKLGAHQKVPPSMLPDLKLIPCALFVYATITFSAEIHKNGDSTYLRSELSLIVGSATERPEVELSKDLEKWKGGIPLIFDSVNETWSVGTGSGLSIFSESKNADESWNLTLDLLLEESNFLRVVRAIGPFPVDPTTSKETKNLLKNIHRIGWDPDIFAFGQEFPLSFTYTDNIGNGDLDQSDSKTAVGDHPGVHGSDFLYMIDQPWHEDFHKDAARRAYQSGAIVTFDYHWAGKYGGDYRAQVDDDKILDYVVRNDDSRGDVTWFYESLDLILGIINDDLQFPIVLRPFHEMDGNWFWWGRQMQGGAETYREAYRLLVRYMSSRTDYVLYCWSPDVALADFEQFYPGDDYVDIVGRDIYSIGGSGRPLSKLTEMIAFAEEHGKVAAFTETGYSGTGTFETADPDWWTTRVLDPIAADPDAGKIAWILTWINASWSGPYIPTPASPQTAKDDFQKFYDSEATLFQTEIAELSVYAEPPND